MTYGDISFQIPISEALDYIDFSESDKDSLKLGYRILAMSEGVHNMLEISATEIELMVSRAKEAYSKRPNKNGYFNIPVVLDHSRDMLDKIGATLEVGFDTAPDLLGQTAIPSCIAKIELWDDTDRQKELLKILRRDPDNIYFSISARGKFIKTKLKDAMAKMVDMSLVHIAIVQEPADKNARIIFSQDIDFSQLEDSLTDINLNTSNKRQQTMENPNIVTDVEGISEVVDNSSTNQIVSTTTTGAATAPPVSWTYTASPSSTASPIKFSYDLKDAETVNKLTKENAELKAANDELTGKLSKLEFALKELDKKVPVIANILALDPSVDQSFIYSLNVDQLTNIQSMITGFNAKIEESSKKTATKGKFATPETIDPVQDMEDISKMTPEQLCAKFYGELEKE